MGVIERSLPQNVDAEELVLGAMMLSNRAAETLAGELEPSMFFRESHGELFALLRGIVSSGEPVEPVAVAAAAERADVLGKIGGKGRLAAIVAATTSTANAPHYAELVRDAWKARLVLQTTESVSAQLFAGKPAEEALGILDHAVAELRRDFADERSRVVPLFQGAQLLDERLRAPIAEDEGVSSPWSFTPKLKPGCLYVLGGYQADGKTAQAAHFLRAACEGGTRTGLVSLEMPWQQMVARIAANLGAPANRVLTGNVRPPERETTTRAIARLAMLDAEIVDHPRVSASEIARYQRVRGYGFVVVDHLHRFHIAEPRLERQELEGIVRDLTDLARRAEIPVLLLSQLSRSGDSKKPYPRPTMASLRGTAMIEAEATIVWFIWRERDEEQMPTEVAHFICAKNRYGNVGSWRMYFSGRMVSFTETTEASV